MRQPTNTWSCSNRMKYFHPTLRFVAIFCLWAGDHSFSVCLFTAVGCRRVDKAFIAPASLSSLFVFAINVEPEKQRTTPLGCNVYKHHTRSIHVYK